MRWTIGILLWVTLMGCREDFDLTTQYVEIPVVYGLLDRQDSVHYLRIQRAYLDSNTSALALATIPDSIYYPDVLDVWMVDDSTGQRFDFARVAGDTIGLPKEEGLFARQPNVLYRCFGALTPRHSFTLYVHHTLQDWTLKAQTSLVGEVESFIPNNRFVVNWTGAPDDREGFAWKRAENAMVYDLVGEFFYWEWVQGSSDSTLRSIPFTIIKSRITELAAPEFVVSTSYATQSFFYRVRSQIAPDTNRIRKPAYIRFTLAAGGTALGLWVANQRVQQGITGGNALEVYTNIEGGIGIFSSRYTTIFNNLLSDRMIDSLVSGSITGHLQFKPW